MIHKIKWLALASLFALASCEQDEPAGTGRGDATDSTQSVVRLSLALDVEPAENSFPNVDEAESEARAVESRTFHFRVQDGVNKFILNDTGGDTNMPSKRAHLDRESLGREAASLKFLLQVRRGHEIVGKYYGTWEYNSRGKAVWRLNAKELTLTGISPSDQLQVRVVSGGNLDAEAGEIQVPDPIYKVIEGDGVVELPVPYASDWMALKYDATKKLYTTEPETTTPLVDKQIHLKPLGVLLVTTLRRENNSVLEGTSVEGIRYVSNALQFTGKYTLDGSDQPTFVSSDETFGSDVVKDAFRSVTYEYGINPIMNVGTSPSPRMIVSWVIPVAGKKTGEAWSTTGEEGFDSQEATNKRIDGMLTGSTTHVYAMGVSTASTSDRFPNFAIVPIMGTVKTFRDGTSAAINAELNVPYRPALGYMAKYTVATDGRHFDKGHNNGDASLVNWTKLKPFCTTDGAEIEGGTGRYWVGDAGLATYLGTYMASVRTDGRSDAAMRKYTNGSRTTFIRITNTKYASWLTMGENLVGSSSYRQVMLVYDPDNSISYSMMGQEQGRNNNPKANRHNSRGACLSYRTYEWPKGKGAFPLGRMTLKSFSLGKYFVGHVFTPISGDYTGYDLALWTEELEGQKGLVTRYLPAAGFYSGVKDEDIDKDTPSAQRIEVGHTAVYWYSVNPYQYWGWHKLVKQLGENPNKHSRGIDWLNDGDVFDQVPTAAQLIPKDQPGHIDGHGGNILFTAVNGVQLSAYNKTPDFMWMALWPYSKTYQGDDPGK